MRGPRQPRQAHLFGVTLVTVVLLAFAAAPASAVHSHAATYTGTFAAGGSIAFDVSADGDSITSPEGHRRSHGVRHAHRGVRLCAGPERQLQPNDTAAGV